MYRFNWKFMIRFIVVIVLCCLAWEVSAQEAEIRKSADVIVVRGKSYYLASGEGGPTFY